MWIKKFTFIPPSLSPVYCNTKVQIRNNRNDVLWLISLHCGIKSIRPDKVSLFKSITIFFVKIRGKMGKIHITYNLFKEETVGKQ